MAGLLCFAVMASFGAVCILWTVFGWLLPGGSGGVVICGPDPWFLRRYLFLRDLGLMNVQLILVAQTLSEAEEKWLQRRCAEIVVVKPGDLPRHLELERYGFDGTGTGDHSGRHRRRGISEL